MSSATMVSFAPANAEEAVDCAELVRFLNTLNFAKLDGQTQSDIMKVSANAVIRPKYKLDLIKTVLDVRAAQTV